MAIDKNLLNLVRRQGFSKLAHMISVGCSADLTVKLMPLILVLEQQTHNLQRSLRKSDFTNFCSAYFRSLTLLKMTKTMESLFFCQFHSFFILLNFSFYCQIRQFNSLNVSSINESSLGCCTFFIFFIFSNLFILFSVFQSYFTLYVRIILGSKGLNTYFIYSIVDCL